MRIERSWLPATPRHPCGYGPLCRPNRSCSFSLKPHVDSNVSSSVAGQTELLIEAGLVLSAVLGEEGVDLSEAAGLVAVFGGSLLPFGQLCVQALSPFTDESENRFAPGFGSGRPVKSLFGSLAVVTPGEAPVTAEFGEGFLGRL